jgi:catalase
MTASTTPARGPATPAASTKRMADTLTFAAAALAALSLGLASSAAFAADAPVTTQIVDLTSKLYGPHPGFRAFHAKGVVAEGTFKASPEARKLSRATLFNGGTIPVTVRFSDGNGLPNAEDGAPASNPHGLAVKYHLPGGADTDMVCNSLKFFPVGTAEDFRDLLEALIASPPDAPKPTRLEQFFARHPQAPKAFGSAATPGSYADEEYHSLDAFILVNQAGQRQAVRYLLVPEKTVHLTANRQPSSHPTFCPTNCLSGSRERRWSFT